MWKTIFKATIFIAAYLGLRPLFKLVEDAVSGWVNAQIGKVFGWQTPTIEQVSGAIWTWVAPLIFVIVCAWLYHKVHTLKEPKTTQAKLEPESEPQTNMGDQPNMSILAAVEHIRKCAFMEDHTNVWTQLTDALSLAQINIWGRKYSAVSVEQNTHPLVLIPRDHWGDFEFDFARCQFAENTRLCKTRPRFNRSLLHDEIFVDLLVNEDAIKARWPLEESDE